VSLMPSGLGAWAVQGAAALLTIVLVVGALTACVGGNPIDALVAMGEGAFGDYYAISETLVQAARSLLSRLGLRRPCAPAFSPSAPKASSSRAPRRRPRRFSR
jgi:hypothetical protein